MKSFIALLTLLLSINLFAFHNQAKSGRVLLRNGNIIQFSIEDIDLDNLYLSSCEDRNANYIYYPPYNSKKRPVLNYDGMIFELISMSAQYEYQLCDIRLHSESMFVFGTEDFQIHVKIYLHTQSNYKMSVQDILIDNVSIGHVTNDDYWEVN